jgi:DNA-binding CsgD family transcriptional regulator
MSMGQLTHGRASYSEARSGSLQRAHIASSESGLTKMRLRESLAREETLLRRVDALIQEQQKAASKVLAWRADAAERLASLTQRERDIMELVVAGHPNKNIAADLGLSRRTVENHRALIMKKTGSKSIPALARLALAAAWTGAPELNPNGNYRNRDAAEKPRSTAATSASTTPRACRRTDCRQIHSNQTWRNPS